ncbi:MAG: hypothetical protein ACP5KW_11240 [Thermoproteota archaeon]
MSEKEKKIWTVVRVRRSTHKLLVQVVKKIAKEEKVVYSFDKVIRLLASNYLAQKLEKGKLEEVENVEQGGSADA